MDEAKEDDIMEDEDETNVTMKGVTSSQTTYWRTLAHDTEL